MKLDGKEILNFSSNDYLGLADNEELKCYLKQAVDRYGIGAGAASLVVGYSKAHRLLEEKLSAFLNREATLLFPSGYQANLAIASALIDSNTVVVQDKLNHASLIDSAMLSKGKLIRYRHRDMEHLSSILEKYKHKKMLIMTDGVFSMEGDVAPINEISELCTKYRAWLSVDDAHGIGVLGPSGAGLLEELNLDQKKVPILIGTFGKAFGAGGAFISGASVLIDTLIQKARTYIYTTALSPAIAMTVNHAVDMVMNAASLRSNLKNLVKHYRRKIGQTDYRPGAADRHIQPLLIGAPTQTTRLSDYLLDRNILVAAIRPPTVPPGTSRLRISFTAGHDIQQVDRLIHALTGAKHESSA